MWTFISSSSTHQVQQGSGWQRPARPIMAIMAWPPINPGHGGSTEAGPRTGAAGAAGARPRVTEATFRSLDPAQPSRTDQCTSAAAGGAVCGAGGRWRRAANARRPRRPGPGPVSRWSCPLIRGGARRAPPLSPADPAAALTSVSHRTLLDPASSSHRQPGTGTAAIVSHSREVSRPGQRC